MGYLICGIKTLADAKVGDTITHKDKPAEEPLEGFSEVKPMVYSGIYPIESKDFEPLRKALEKLQLNDAAFTFEAENSDALGFWFSMWLLGTSAHGSDSRTIGERVQSDLINTSPSVIYKKWRPRRARRC